MFQPFVLRRVLLILCYLGVITMPGGLAAANVDTNSTPVPNEFIGPRTAWGEETNGFRAGLVWGDSPSKMDVAVIVLTFKTNIAWKYVAPPGRKFLKFELKDAKGAPLKPLKGKELDGELPKRIRTKDLPHTPEFAHHASMLQDWLLLSPGLPGPLRDVFIQDTYKIDKEGDYSLTILASVYEFETGEQTVSRVDLLPVTAKLHLTPTPGEK
jgi:hypothetical protein